MQWTSTGISTCSPGLHSENQEHGELHVSGRQHQSLEESSSHTLSRPTSVSLPASQHDKSSTSIFSWFGTHLGPQAEGPLIFLRFAFIGLEHFSTSESDDKLQGVDGLATQCFPSHSRILLRVSVPAWVDVRQCSSPSCRIVCTQIDILYYFIDDFVVVFSLYVTNVSISQSHSVRVCSTRTLRAWGLQQTCTDPHRRLLQYRTFTSPFCRTFTSPFSSVRVRLRYGLSWTTRPRSP